VVVDSTGGGAVLVAVCGFVGGVAVIQISEVVSLTQTLVRMDSVAAPMRPHEEAVARFLAEYLEQSGFSITLEQVAPKRLNLMARFDTGSPGRLLILEGHTDVVIEGERSTWHKDPFSGELEDGKLWGRGSADMKGGLAAAIVAAKTVRREFLAGELQLKGELRLLIPCDEEGMMSGIKQMVQHGWHTKNSNPADGAIVCEPEELELCLWQRGGIRVAMYFLGKQAHGAMPYAGINPIPWLAQALVEIGQLEATLQTQTSEHPMLGKPSITPTVVQAGSLPQLNVMPGDALLALDIRTVPGVDHAKLHQDLRQILAHIPNAKTEYQIIDDRPWTATDPTAPIVQVLETACRAVLGREPRYGGVPGTTDGTFLHAAGVPIVTVGPGDREIPHQANEFVRISELEQSVQLYTEAIRLFLGSKHRHSSSQSEGA
jgi:succinyl-diaminopimelate desuccinylase